MLLELLQKDFEGNVGAFNLFFLFAVDNSGTSDSTGPSGGDETDLLTWRSVTSNSRRFTNMLMVTTTVGMLDWVFGYTSHLWPAVSLHAELVVGSAGLEHWLVDSSTARNEAKHSSVSAAVKFFDTRWEFHSSFAGVSVVGNDGAVSTRGLGDLASVTRLLFERAHDGTFWHLSNWHDITDIELSLFTGMNKLAGANALWAHHGLGDFSVLVWVLELNLGKWSAPAWIVYDILHKTLDEALSLGIVKAPQFSSALSAFASTGKN